MGDKNLRSVGTTSEVVMEGREEFWLRTDASPSRDCHSLDPLTNGGHDTSKTSGLVAR